MTNPTYGILSWSGKTFRARKNYCCRNCGGIIPIGVVYHRDVERLGVRRGKDPLRNVHFHLDCDAPWYQPGDTHRLRSLGRLPYQTPPAEVYDREHGYLKPAIAVTSPTLGNLQWQLPSSIAEKLAFVPEAGLAVSAVAEIEYALQIVLTALVDAHGHKRKSMKLNHLLNEIADNLKPLA
jgi:hypothetical protein